MIRQILIILALGLATALALPTALAVPPPRPPLVIQPPELDAPESALSDAWTLTCESAAASHCALHGVFIRARPTDAPARLRLDPAAALAIDRVLIDGTPTRPDTDGTVALEPGENPATIELFAATPIFATSDSGYVIPAIHARHLAAHIGRHREHFAFAVRAAAHPRPGVYTQDVQSEAHGPLHADTRDATWTEGARTGDATEITFTHPGARAHFGGPMLGLGASTGHNAHFRMRTGLEMGWSTWGLASLVFDTDFRGSHVIAPQVEFSTPSLVFIPLSLTAGVGMPIQLGDDKRIGARLSVGLHFLVVGLVTSFDLWPGRPQDQADVTVMALFTL